MKTRDTSGPRRGLLYPASSCPASSALAGGTAPAVRRGTNPFGLTSFVPFAAVGSLPLDLALDELLHQVAAGAVVELLRRGLHEVGAGRGDRAADAAVLGDLAGAQRVDDHAGRVRRVPDLELVFQVQRHVAEGPALQAHERELAVVEPRHVVGRADVDVA